MGQDNYPTDIQRAVHMLTHWKGNRKDNNNTSIPGNGQGNRNRANAHNRMQFVHRLVNQLLVVVDHCMLTSHAFYATIQVTHYTHG